MNPATKSLGPLQWSSVGSTMLCSVPCPKCGGTLSVVQLNPVTVSLSPYEQWCAELYPYTLAHAHTISIFAAGCAWCKKLKPIYLWWYRRDQVVDCLQKYLASQPVPGDSHPASQ